MREPIFRDLSDADSYLPTRDELAAFYASAEWLKLSYETKVAYGRRCQMCGAKPEDGARIVTDHIRPVKYFWHLRLTPSNLQVACDDCNLGKGSADTNDYRPEPIATDAVMDLLREKIGLANLHSGPSAAKEIVTDANSYGEISGHQTADLIKHFGLEAA